MSRKKNRSKREVRLQLRTYNEGDLEFQSELSRNAPSFTSKNHLSSAWGNRGLADIQFTGDRHYHPERLPSSRHERPRSARLSNTFYQNLDFVASVAATINTLDLSGLGMFGFPEELAEKLLNIETLILDNNNLTSDSFPVCFKDMSSLLNLSVRNNKLNVIPSCWSSLFHLTDLNLEWNNLKNTKLIERYTKLKTLNLEHNQIDTLPRDFFSLKKLEYLNISQNLLSILPTDIKKLINLRELHLSSNKITSVTPDLFLLPRIDGINLRFNKISKIPSVNLKTQNKRKINTIDLSDNTLLRFPENVFHVCESLDLSRNNIRVINNNVFKRLPWNSKTELFVNDNPITQPPRAVCEGGLRSMLHHYYETQVDNKIYQGIKLYVIGTESCGKTSLVQSFVDQQSRPTSEDEDTIVVDVLDYYIDTSEDPSEVLPLNLSIWDFSGKSFYLHFTYSFLHLPSVTLIVFDLSTYTEEAFHHHIGQYIDLLILKNNKAIFILIGSKADLCKDNETAEDILHKAQLTTEKYLNDYLQSINHEIRNIETLDQITTSFNEHYRQLLQLKNFKVLFHPETLATSSLTMDGIEQLRHILIDLATQTKTFPSVMRAIPALWGDVDNFLDDFSQSQSVVTFSEIEEIIHKKFGLKHLTKQILQYLQECGKAVFLEKDPCFSKLILLHPGNFIDWFKCIYRHDLEQYLIDPADPHEIRERFLKVKSETVLDYTCQLASSKGIITTDLMKIVWGTGKRRFMFLNYLCDVLQWSYRIGNIKDGETEYNLNFEIDKTNVDVSNVKVLCPPLVNQLEPERSSVIWNQTSHHIGAGFRFLKTHPPLFFERLTVRLQNLLHLQYHWTDGLLCSSIENQKVYIKVTKEMPEDNSYVVIFCGAYYSKDKIVTIDLKSENLNDEREEETDEFEPLATSERKRATTEIWKCLFPAILEAEKLAKEYPGAWYRRIMRCPECLELTFFGEWLSPKEAQSLPSKTCPICKNVIPIDLLIQPKVAPKRLSRPTTASQISTQHLSDEESD